MLDQIETRGRTWHPAAFAGLLLIVTAAAAGESADPLADLEARVAQLEQDQRTQRGVQDSQVSVLQQRLDALTGTSESKTYPNVAVNGVFQADAGFFHQDGNSLATYGGIQDGADFRRARLQARGGLTPSVNYFFQMDFAFFGRPTFTDLWVEQSGIPILGNVRVGQ